MTGSDLPTKLVLLVYLYFERSYGNNSLLDEFLNLGISKNNLEKALRYLVDEGYLVKTLTLQPEDRRLKKRIGLPSSVTDECRLMWRSYADSSKWENAFDKISKILLSSQQGQAKSSKLTALDHFVIITCLVNTDEFRYFNDAPAKLLAESIGIDAARFKESISKLIKTNLIFQVTNGVSASALFGKLRSLYQIELRPLGISTVSLIPEFKFVGLAKYPTFLIQLVRHKAVLNKRKRLQVSESKQVAKGRRPPEQLLKMGLTDKEVHNLAAMISPKVFRALGEIFIYAIWASLRISLNECLRAQEGKSDSAHLFRSIDTSVSAIVNKVLSYEEHSIFAVAEISESPSFSSTENGFLRKFVVSALIAEAVAVSVQLAKQCQVFFQAHPCLDFSHCSYADTFGVVWFKDKTESSEVPKTPPIRIRLSINGILIRAQEQSRPVVDSIIIDGDVHEVEEMQILPLTAKYRKILNGDLTN